MDGVKYRATSAYPCAYWRCTKQGVIVETVKVSPNGMPSSVAFYGWCEEHMPGGVK